MAGTFADFIAWADKEVVILAELTPSLRLRGWTAVGGAAPNTYQISLPRLVQADLVTGGAYRRVGGVRENGTDLTEQASLAAVDANASSWYWDEAAGVLYVHSSTGSDPDLFTAYQAFVTFYIASRGVVLDRVDGDASTGIYYHPWLTGELPTLTQEVEDILFGIKTTPMGSVTMTNGHRFWNAIVAPDGDYHWKNKRVRFYVGGNYNGLTLARSQYAAIMTMQVEDVAADETACQLMLKPLARQTEISIPPTPYFESSYPNLGEGVRGTHKWIGYGRATIRPDLTDTTSHGVWTLADAANQTLYAVHDVSAISKTTGVRTALSEGVDYSKDLTACTVTITSATYRWEDYDMEVDVTGKPGGTRGYLSTFSEIVEDILTTFLGVAAGDIDAAAFATAQLDAPEELAVWLKSPRVVSSVLQTSQHGFPSLERSVMGTVQQTLAGLWTCWIWDPSYDPSSVVQLRKEDFAQFLPQPKFDTVFATARVYFNENHARGEWPIEQASDTEVQWLDESRDRLDVYTFLRSAADASTLAERYQLISGAVSMEVEFAERGSKLAQALAGDKVLVTFDPAPSAAGAYEQKPFEILRLTRGFSPGLTIAGRLGDLRGVGAVVGHWMADTDPAWSAATSEERARSGFWTDDDGLADPADAASATSIWW